VLRLAGLYNINRGAHNFYIKKGEVKQPSNGVINQLHYDDAASACAAALVADRQSIRSQVFLISDGSPMTRYDICRSTLKAFYYQGKSMPTFSESSGENSLSKIGKIYDAKVSSKVLAWQPEYSSFDAFMTSNS